MLKNPKVGADLRAARNNERPAEDVQPYPTTLSAINAQLPILIMEEA